MAELARIEGQRTTVRARGRPSPEEAAQIDREILNAARDLFFRQGFERTSMAMIIRAAGVSKTTLYSRYPTKAELFQATVTFTVERIANSTLSTAERHTRELAEGLELFGCDALKISLSPLWQNYERLVFTEGPRFPELAEAVAARADIGIQNISRFIAECAERDRIPCRDPVAVGTVYVMALRGFYTSALSRVRRPNPEECRQFVRAMVATLLAGRDNW
jgi:TetR/AcrR family transcriptional repressor of mexJK operon